MEQHFSQMLFRPRGAGSNHPLECCGPLGSPAERRGELWMSVLERALFPPGSPPTQRHGRGGVSVTNQLRKVLHLFDKNAKNDPYQ